MNKPTKPALYPIHGLVGCRDRALFAATVQRSRSGRKARTAPIPANGFSSPPALDQDRRRVPETAPVPADALSRPASGRLK